jgi:hypothetical protein
VRYLARRCNRLKTNLAAEHADTLAHKLPFTVALKFDAAHRDKAQPLGCGVIRYVVEFSSARVHRSPRDVLDGPHDRFFDLGLRQG